MSRALLGDVIAVARAWRARDWLWIGTLGALTLFVTGMPLRYFDGLANLFNAWLYHSLQFGLPLLFGLRVADRAVARGVRPLLAYGIAALGSVVLGVWVIARLLWPLLGKVDWWTASDDLWLALGVGVFVCLGVALYARWREQLRLGGRLQQSQAAAVEARRRLALAELLALQARVDPDLLFDALQQIERRIEGDAAAAEVQLDALIALLRTLLPRGVERGSAELAAQLGDELALAQRWASVVEARSLLPPALLVTLTPQAERATLAPMLLLPLWRALAGSGASGWVLRGESGSGRLVVDIAPRGDSAALARLPVELLDQLQARLRAVHGETACLAVIDAPAPTLRLQLPLAKSSASRCLPADELPAA